MILFAAISNLTGRQVFNYMLMPEILPRLNNLFQKGFSSIATFMAFVYLGVKLLPQNHPYLQPHAFGSYGIRDVVREAASNLDYSYKHIDQIIIFFALIAGLIILALQFLLLLIAFFVNPASAQVPTNYQEFFVTAAPDEDLAFRILDAVFGVDGLFNSKEEVGRPFHEALQGLFTIYSTGLLVVAGIILIYFIFVVVSETAQTGTPFGKRFNHAWAPIRLVVGIALLIPIGSGFNSAQWITLYAAKFGSGFATNSWQIFNDTLDGSMVEEDESVATPEVPDVDDFIAHISIAHACKEGYVQKRPSIGNDIHAYVLNDQGLVFPISSYSYALAAAGSSGVVTVVFGVHDTDEFQDHRNSIAPFCGQLSLTVPETRSGDYLSAIIAGACDFVGLGECGQISSAEIVSKEYFYIMKDLWQGASGDGFDFSEFKTKSENVMKEHLLGGDAFADDQPDAEYRGQIQTEVRARLETAIEEAVEELREEMAEDTEEYEKYGWAGAGIWYNKLANWNGALANAVLNKPVVSKYPTIMEYTCAENQQQNANVDPLECYAPRLSEDRPVEYEHPADGAMATGQDGIFRTWNSYSNDVSGNAFLDTINLIFGTKGVFDMCKNADIHPLAQLSAAGKGLIETAIRNFAVSIGSKVLSNFIAGPALNAASGLAASIAGIGLLIGFILYYMVPFMPFLYFFFAVGTWVRGIFEAMVGVPLWALAHLRIDGEGLPGEAASNGYFLIFEVFVRPILILFGLLASILIFAAMVRVLNEVFHLVTSNFTGGQVSNICGAGAGAPDADAASPPPVSMMDYFRGPVDQFFFSVLYAIIVYLTGNSCFKLIDTIPNQILRWMGTGAKSFGDDAGQVAENVIRNVAVGGGMLSGQVSGIASSAMEAGGEGARGVFSTFFGGGSPAGRGPSGPRATSE